MKTAELQNKIIRKILEIKDNDFLDFINSLLSKDETPEYKFSEFEKRIIEESSADYKSGKLISHDEVLKKAKNL